jgi:hypothetical protein
MKEHRDGVQTGFWQKVLLNETALSATIRSRLGVTAPALPR